MGKETISLRKLIECFAALPGIGMKTAQRLAYHILKLNREQVEKISTTILDSYDKIVQCNECKDFTDKVICMICGDNTREDSIICVVETPKDVKAIENTREYKGKYHVLHGLISPMDGIGPEDIYVKELIERIGKGKVKEVIMATNATVEGEATAIYLSKLIKPLGVKATRLAYGMPVGGELEYADEMTLYKALENRNEI